MKENIHSVKWVAIMIASIVICGIAAFVPLIGIPLIVIAILYALQH